MPKLLTSGKKSSKQGMRDMPTTLISSNLRSKCWNLLGRIEWRSGYRFERGCDGDLQFLCCASRADDLCSDPIPTPGDEGNGQVLLKIA